MSIANKLAPLAAGDKKLQAISERFESLRLELEEVASDLEAFGEDTEVNPNRLEEVEDRLNLLYKLQTKHAVKDNEELIGIYEELSNRLGEFADLGSQITKLEKERERLLASLLKQGDTLRKGRQQVAPQFATNVRKQLADLSMANARLEVDFQAPHPARAQRTRRGPFPLQRQQGGQVAEHQGRSFGR